MTDPIAAPEQVAHTPGPIVRWGRRAAHALRRALNRLLNSLLDNPIVRKELRGRMRGWRAVAVLTAHLTLLSCFASLIYFGVAQSANTVDVSPVGQEMGQVLFYSTYMLLLMLVVFLSPAFTAGTLSGERERKTLDLLITTLLPTRALILGKLASALAYMLLLILAALPIQSLALMFGGITLAEVLVGTLILIATALAAGSIGLFVSALMRSTLASTALTYAAILLTTLGLPMAALVSTSLFGIMIVDSVDRLTWVAQAVLLYLAGFLICTSPFATAVATKLIQDQKNSLFFFRIPIQDITGAPHLLPLISPWVVYVVLCVLLSGALAAASIAVVNRRRG